MATWANVAAPAGKGFFWGDQNSAVASLIKQILSWKVLFSKGHEKIQRMVGKKLKFTRVNQIAVILRSMNISMKVSYSAKN